MTDVPEDVRKLARSAALDVFAAAVDSDDDSHSLDNAMAFDIIVAAIMADREKRGEPVAWQPKYKQDVIDHHRSNGDDFWEYAMTIFKTKEGAETYGLGAHEVRPLYAAPPAAPESVKDDESLWNFWSDKAREQAKTITELRERLAFLNAHTNLELTWGEIDGWDDDCQWCIHSRNGGRNDREWTLRGYGSTVEQAIDAARSALDAEGK